MRPIYSQQGVMQDVFNTVFFRILTLYNNKLEENVFYKFKNCYVFD